jgi:hypothetical protein
LTIQCDTREHKKEWERIKSQFDGIGVDYFRSKLWVGDYMNIDNPRVIIDRKKDLLELCGNVTQQHKRFAAELIRAQEKNIKLIILCEHGEGIETLTDVYFWHNPRLDLSEWVIQNGHPAKIPKYPKATEGTALYRSLITMRDKYNIDFRFCEKSETGCVITQLLGG